MYFLYNFRGHKLDCFYVFIHLTKKDDFVDRLRIYYVQRTMGETEINKSLDSTNSTDVRQVYKKGKKPTGALKDVWINSRYL